MQIIIFIVIIILLLLRNTFPIILTIITRIILKFGGIISTLSWSFSHLIFLNLLFLLLLLGNKKIIRVFKIKNSYIETIVPVYKIRLSGRKS